MKIKELEADIAMEQNVENVLSIRSEIFEIMKVGGVCNYY